MIKKLMNNFCSNTKFTTFAFALQRYKKFFKIISYSKKLIRGSLVQAQLGPQWKSRFYRNVEPFFLLSSV